MSADVLVTTLKSMKLHGMAGAIADLADQVWSLWNEGVITDDLAAWAWLLVANQCTDLGHHRPL